MKHNDNQFTATKKVIKVGSSFAVTLPAAEAKAHDIKPGDEIEYTAHKVLNDSDLLGAYEQFKSRYGKTLKNLKDR